jgi:WD40 repeat protein
MLEGAGTGVGIARYAVSADGSRVAGIEEEGRLYLWNADTGELIGDAAERPGTARGLAFSPSEPAILALGSTGGGIALYDVDQDRLIGEPLLGHGSGPRDVAVSADGATLVSIADDGLIGLWGRNDAGGPLGTPDPDVVVFDETGHEWEPPDAGFDKGFASTSPDGRRVVGIDYTFTHLRTWDAESGARLGDARPPAPVSSGRPRFSADGRYVDVVSDFELIRYDGTDLREVASIRTPFAIQGEVVQVPGTDHVIGAGLGGYVGRFDLGDGTVVAVGRSRDSSNLESASISADGTMIATYHPYSFRVALFDAATLRPIGRPFLAGDLVFVPRFTSDGHLTGNGLFNVPTRWDVEPASWREAACHAAGRNLTREEWVEYLGSEPYRGTCTEWDAAE